MKKTFCAIAIAASLFTVSALAQNTRSKGIPTLVKSTGTLKGTFPTGVASLTPPPPCFPTCLFYGGDINSSSPDENGFANENTLLVPDTQVWGAFNVPAGQTWTVDGLFINTIADGYDGIDPTESTWAIASGVSAGNAGTTVASGTSTASGTQFTTTGRFPFGFTEYSLRVRIPATVLSSGTYWVNITPQCTDSGNSSCSVSQYYFDNTFGLNRYGPLEPADEGFFSSGYFGYDYANDCTVSSTGCQALSFGVIGTGTTD